MLLETLVMAFTDMIVAIETSDDRVVDPSFAMAVFDDLAATLGTLAIEERSQLLQLIIEYADSQPDDRRRERIAALTEGLGLTDES